MTPNRLSGHTLESEGAPFAWTTNGGRYVRTFGRQGVGLCSCGETSSTLDSNSARKRWHREHKDELRRGPAPTEGNTAASVKSTAPAGPTLVIAHTTKAARTLADELAAEHGLNPADMYPLAIGASPHSRAYAAAVIALPPRGLRPADVEWIEDCVLVRLKRGAELVVRFNPRRNVLAHRPPHPPGTAEEPALVERIAVAIENLCPEPDAEHLGDHCPYREAADTARKVGAAG